MNLKTVAITQLQLGEEAKVVNLVVSTVKEVEHLLPFLLECREQNKPVNASNLLTFGKINDMAKNGQRYYMEFLYLGLRSLD